MRWEPLGGLTATLVHSNTGVAKVSGVSPSLRDTTHHLIPNISRSAEVIANVPYLPIFWKKSQELMIWVASVDAGGHTIVAIDNLVSDFVGLLTTLNLRGTTSR